MKIGRAEIMSQFTPLRILSWFIVGIFLLLGVGLFREIISARDAATASTCSGMINPLRYALETYKGDKGKYPPAYVADANGKPMHSWRVLLLPYIAGDEQKLYDAYKFDEPWDGPNNRKLADNMPGAYRCCLQESDSITPFLMVTSSDNKQSINQSEDDPIHLIELHSKQVNWMKPDDISLDELKKILASNNHEKDSLHQGKIGFSSVKQNYGRFEPDAKGN